MNLINYRKIIFLVLLFMFGLTACVGAEPIGVPTATPTVTETSLPTPTVTASATAEPTLTPSPPQPTRTVTKLATLPPAEAINLGVAIKVPAAGFSFKSPSGFRIEQTTDQVTMTSIDGQLVIALSGITVARVEDLDPIIHRYMDIISRTFTDFQMGTCSPYVIGGTSGLSCNLQAKLENAPVSGMGIIAAPQETQLFYALIFVLENPQGDEWDQWAKPVTEKILAGVTFFAPVNP